MLLYAICSRACASAYHAQNDEFGAWQVYLACIYPVKYREAAFSFPTFAVHVSRAAMTLMRRLCVLSTALPDACYLNA